MMEEICYAVMGIPRGDNDAVLATTLAEIDNPPAPTSSPIPAPSVLKPCSTPQWLKSWAKREQLSKPGESGADLACDGDL